ncbi:MAG: glycogen/starch/alpha-glucan phosphorylase [Nitrospirae bacterium]|nr:glycogen/starch/alpha-glucan phosphorylase [Nitrospirota bacterium]
MKEENGDENIFVFGLHAGEVENLKRTGYNPYSYYQSNR